MMVEPPIPIYEEPDEYSRHSLPEDIFDVDIDPEEEILEEGELLKFKPGFDKNFI